MSETGSIKLKRKFISVISERHQKENDSTPASSEGPFTRVCAKTER